MSKFWLINLIDKVFITVCVFLAIFAWINFYIRDLWTTFLLSIVFTFAIVFVLYYFLGKKHEKINLTKKQLSEMNKYLLAFRLTNKNEQLNIIKELLSKEHETKLDNGYLTYSDAFGKHLVIIATHFQKLNENDLINILNEYFNEKFDCFDIICNDFSNLNTEILKNKKIIMIDGKKLYNDYFMKYGIYPNTENLNENITKLKFKDIANNIFLPQKAKSYFLCGLVLIFSSIILPYHFYYIIFGSMLMMFAIICKILPKIK